MVRDFPGSGLFTSFFILLGLCLIPTASQAGQTVYLTSCCQSGASVSMIDSMMLMEMGMMPAANGTTAVAIGPDNMTGYIGLSQSSGDVVEEMDLNNGMMMLSFPAGNGATAIAIAPDNSAGYVANRNDGSVTVFDPATGMVTAQISVLPGGACLDAGVSPDSSKAYVVCQLSPQGQASQSVLGVIANNQLAKSIALPGTEPFPGNNLLAITPDGTMAYIAGISTAKQTGFASVDLMKEAVMKFFHLPSMTYGLAVDPMMPMVLFSSGNGVLNYIDAKTGKITGSTSLRSSGKGGVVAYMGGMRVAVASVDDDVVAVIDNTDGQLCAQIPVGAQPQRVVISPNEMMSLSGNTYTTAVNEFDSTTGTWLGAFEGGTAPVGVMMSPQGSMTYVVNQGMPDSGAGSGVAIMDMAMGGRTIIPVAGASNGVLRPDQKVVYLGAAKGTISIVNTKQQYVMGKISLGASVTGAPMLAVSSDSKTLYATYLPSAGGSALAIINTSTKQITSTISLGTGTLSASPAITLSSNGSLAYVALTAQSEIAIVDLNKQQLQQTVNVGTGVYPSCIGIQPGGMSAYVPSNTGVVVLDLISNTVAGTIQISGVPQNVAFTMDGSMAFVSVMNGNAVIIDTAIDKVIQQLPATNTLGIAIM